MNDFDSYTPEVQTFIQECWDMANFPMRKNEIYVNSKGYKYKVIEDALEEKFEVDVIQYLPFGQAKRTGVFKLILIS